MGNSVDAPAPYNNESSEMPIEDRGFRGKALGEKAYGTVYVRWSVAA
jgi:hypothetical protein